MGAELSINIVEIFDENGNECTNLKYISTIKLMLKDCNNLPDKLPLHLEYNTSITNEYFDIDKNTNLIFYKGLLIGEIFNIFYMDTNLLIYIQNIAFEPFIIKMVINTIKKNEEKKKILNNEFHPLCLYNL
jgi:hypothetical protein